MGRAAGCKRQSHLIEKCSGTLIHDWVLNGSSIATGVEGGDDGSVKSVTHGAAVVSVHPGEWYSCIPMYLAE